MQQFGRPIFILLLLGCTTAFAPPANFLDNLKLPKKTIPKKYPFLAPNEKNPQHLKPLVKQAPMGAYISVGTERGFIGAALTPGATHLVLTDIDPNVVQFNQINIALLTLSGSQSEYLKLRMAQDEKAWTQIGLTAENYQFWKKSTEAKGFQEFHNPDSGTFQNANYLFDPILFKKLQTMAKEGKIAAIHLNLEDTENVLALGKYLKSKNIPLSVLDISNAWKYGLLKGATTHPYVEALEAITLPSSLLVATTEGWRYRTISLENLRKDKMPISHLFLPKDFKAVCSKILGETKNTPKN